MSIDYKISHVFVSKTDLVLAYMPMFKNGGLVLPCAEEISMGSTVEATINVSGLEVSFCFVGKVVWLVPRNRYFRETLTVGMQFSQHDAEIISNKIGGFTLYKETS